MKLRHLLYFLVAVPFVFAACNDEPELTPVADPSVSITAGQATATSLTFSIDVKDAVSAAYVVVEASETEPTAETIISSGEPVAVNKVTTVIADGLNAETEYQIVAAAAGNNKTVKSLVVKMTTLKDENGNQNPEPEPSEVFKLTSEAEMSFEAAGGFGFITYEIVSPIEGAEVDATCEAAWVALTPEDQIAFVVSPNNETTPRETKIVVTYGEEHSFEVAIKQAAASAGPIEGFNVEFTSASYTMTSQYGDAEVYQFRTDDNVQANVYFEKSLAHPLAPGTYKATEYVAANEPTFSISDSRVSFYDNEEKVTGVYFTGGTNKVEIVDGQYVVTFDTTISYNNGIPFKATFNGLFANDTVWTGNEEPEPTPEYNTWTSASLKSIGSGIVELLFTDAENNVFSTAFYVAQDATYLPAGTYTPGITDAGKYSMASSLTVDGTRYDFNGDLNLNSTIEVALAADDTYTFTFNDIIFGADKKVTGTWTGKIDGLTQEEQGGNEGGGSTLDVDHVMNTVANYNDGGNAGYTFTIDGSTTKTAFVRVILNDADRVNGMAPGTYTHKVMPSSTEYPSLAQGEFCVQRYSEDPWYGSITYGRNVQSASMTVDTSNNTFTVIITVDGITFGYQGVPEGWTVAGGGNEGGNDEGGNEGGNEGGDQGGNEDGQVYDNWCESVTFGAGGGTATFSGNGITIFGYTSTFALNTPITLSNVTLNGTAVSETGTFTLSLGGSGDFIADLTITIGADTYKAHTSFNL